MPWCATAVSPRPTRPRGRRRTCREASGPQHSWHDHRRQGPTCPAKVTEPPAQSVQDRPRGRQSGSRASVLGAVGTIRRCSPTWPAPTARGARSHRGSRATSTPDPRYALGRGDSRACYHPRPATDAVGVRWRRRDGGSDRARRFGPAGAGGAAVWRSGAEERTGRRRGLRRRPAHATRRRAPASSRAPRSGRAGRWLPGAAVPAARPELIGVRRDRDVVDLHLVEAVSSSLARAARSTGDAAPSAGSGMRERKLGGRRRRLAGGRSRGGPAFSSSMPCHQAASPEACQASTSTIRNSAEESGRTAEGFYLHPPARRTPYRAPR